MRYGLNAEGRINVNEEECENMPEAGQIRRHPKHQGKQKPEAPFIGAP